MIKQEIRKSLFTAVWFMFLTFPIMVIRINTISNTVEWRWNRMAMVGVGSFFLSFLWRYLMRRKEGGNKKAGDAFIKPFFQRILKTPRYTKPALIVTAVFFLAVPFIFPWDKTTLMTNVLIYVIIALGLNIVVGLAGLLDLGYVAFFAVGAYTYALLNYHFGINFWLALPIGAGMGALFGILLGFPVLRLRGDYLAIVTLGFGEIIRMILENWNEFSFGPSGISNIPAPGFLGLDLTLQQTHIGIYYITAILAMLTIIVVRRLQDSRIGRAWIALREDEVACQAMGIDKTKTKLIAFALGATWAGMGGVVFAAKNTIVNPDSFTILESILILCIVVLGGMGSIAGIIIAAVILVLLPELLKVFSDYRWLIFGAVLVIMMVFRPGGIISDVRKIYTFDPADTKKRAR